MVLAGDINSVPHFIDHADYTHKSLESKIAFIEFYEAPWRVWFKQILSDVFIDSFRKIHPAQNDAYTCWNVVTSARESNYGTRIDYILVSKNWGVNVITDAATHPNIMGSDHCPISVELAIEDSINLTANVSIKSMCPCYIPADKTKGKGIKSFFPIKAPSSAATVPSKTKISGDISETPSNPKKLKTCKPAVPKTIDSFFKKSKEVIVIDPIVVDDDDEKYPEDEEDGLQAVDHMDDETAVGPDVKDAWKKLFKDAKGKTPLCSGHREPCKMLRVNKKGANQGRLFFMCARPPGPESHPEKEKFRCKHFEWAKRKV